MSCEPHLPLTLVCVSYPYFTGS